MSIERESDAAQSRTVHEKPLITRMLEGAGMIAFMSLFTMFSRSARTELSLDTRLIGFLLAALAGSVGGLAYYASDAWRARRGIFKTVANVASILTYVVAAVLFVGLWAVLGGRPLP
jgi:uncharacterized membrane protein YjdF